MYKKLLFKLFFLIFLLAFCVDLSDGKVGHDGYNSGQPLDQIGQTQIDQKHSPPLASAPVTVISPPQADPLPYQVFPLSRAGSAPLLWFSNTSGGLPPPPFKMSSLFVKT
jgi:hypothetical protein